MALGFGLRLGLSTSLSSFLGDSSFWGTSSFYASFQNEQYYNGSTTSFDDMFTFSRSTTGTYVDADGIVQTAAIDEPRFDYATSKRGLLVEESATNLISRSNDFSYYNPWPTDATDGAIAKDQIGPDGVLNSATTFSDTGFALAGRTTNSAVLNDTSIYTGSIFFKKTVGATSYPGFGIVFRGGSAVFGQVTVNTNEGTLTDRAPYGPLSKKIESVGDYWRVSVSQANNASGNTNIVTQIWAAVNTDGSGTWVWSTTGSCVIYGAQLEIGSFPTSYIPTSGSQATRAADALTVTPAQMAGSILSKGSELITNGTFDSDTSGWTIFSAGTLSHATDKARITKTGGAANTGIQQNITKPASGFVRVTGDIVIESGSLQSGSFTVRNLYGGAVATGLTATGSFDVVIELDGATDTIAIYGYASACTFTIDNVSVKELSMPAAVSIAMEGSVSYADTNSGTSGGGDAGEVIFLSWTNGGTNYIETALSTAGSRTGEIVFHQRASAGLGAEVKIDTADDYFSPDRNVSFNLASRHSAVDINGAEGGTALTADTTPTALPDLAGTNFEIGSTYNGVIYNFKAWNSGLTDAELEEVTSS